LPPPLVLICLLVAELQGRFACFVHLTGAGHHPACGFGEEGF
jgi:hypothetical protein